MNSGKQEHDGESLLTLHWEFAPHGDGWHGLEDIVIGCSTINVKIKNSELASNISAYIKESIS